MDTQHQPRNRWLSIPHPWKGRGTRAVIGIFVLLTCIRVWVGPTQILNQAQAQIPDSGMQRKLLLDEARRTNQLLGRIEQFLKTHTFNVRIKGADNKADGPATPGGG